MSDIVQHADQAPATFDDDFTLELRQNRLPQSERLRGRSFDINFQNSSAQVHFDDNGHAQWQGLPLDAALAEGKGIIDVVEAADKLFFISLPLPPEYQTSAILIVDERSGHVSLVKSQIDATRKSQGHATNLIQTLYPARLAGISTDSPAPHITTDLMGKRALSIYSPQLAVEHIYINSQWYTYHIIGGDRHGDCDCDEATFYKLRDGAYLVLFREKAVDVAIVFVFDTQAWHSTGMAVGMVDSSGQFNSAPIGAQMQLLGHTLYPDGIIPR